MKEKELTLETLAPARGARKNKKRVGRGASSGKGRSCGRGRGGSGHHSGNSRLTGFEGGQMPLVRRLPKRGFSNKKFQKLSDIINISDIQDNFKSSETVSPEKLIEKGLIKSKKARVKILGSGELKKKVKVSGCALSEGAKNKIKEAGGEIS
ncbi:MAG: 50S ribosomal protein L15 [Elusimicrobiota bacterium]|nr:50S ribosomal protein L15 [Elusimicrobiota bacterium]